MATSPKSYAGLAMTLLALSLIALRPSLSLPLSFPEAVSVVKSTETVYDILPQYGLPSGLLPDSVVDYSLSDDGSFVVVLAKPCYVKFDYLVYYDSTITGKLSYGSITHIKGIQVQKLFLWLNVDEIRVDLPPSNNIYFQVGLINKKLNIDQFNTVHSCRDSVTAAPCLLRSFKGFVQLPAQVDEIPMLLTE